MKRIAHILAVGLLGAALPLPTSVAAQTPTGQFAATVVSVTPALALKAGVAGSFEVVIRNTGAASWSNAGANAVKLGTAKPQDHAGRFYHSDWLSPNRAATMQEATVSPGESAHFAVPVIASGAGTPPSLSATCRSRASRCSCENDKASIFPSV